MGNYEAVYRSTNDCCDHFIHLNAVLEPDGETLSPATRATPEARKNRGVAIDLANNPQLSEITSGDYCVTGDEFKKFMTDRGDKRDWRRACDPLHARCRIYTHVEGWSVELSVHRSLYPESQKLCKITKYFLKTHTISMDTVK